MARLRPELAIDMLARNVVSNPSAAPYIFGKINFNVLPSHDGSFILRSLMERTKGQPVVITGDVETVLNAHGNQQYARSLRLRAVSEDRDALDRYIGAVQEYSEAAAIRTMVANASLTLAADDVDVDSFKRELMDKMAKASTHTSDLRDIGNYSTEAMDYFGRVRAGIRPGLGLGFGKDVDDAIWFEPGGLTVVGSRPGGGKTSLITSSILATATPQSPHAFFSLEMPGYTIAQRIACSMAGVPYHSIMRNRVTDRQYDDVMTALGTLENRGILIDDGVATISDIMFRAMSLPVKPSVIWIDYVELVQMEGSFGRDDLAIAHIYISAKRIAKQIGCHVVLLSQLDRSVDSREDKWPTMRDLVRSSASEKNADQIIFVMRPEYYWSRGDRSKLLAPGDTTGVGYLILAKSRNGPPDVKRVAFNAPLMQFSEYIPEENQQDESTATIGAQYFDGRSGGTSPADLEQE